MELSTVHGLLLLFIGVAIVCYSALRANFELRVVACDFHLSQVVLYP